MSFGSQQNFQEYQEYPSFPYGLLFSAHDDGIGPGSQPNSAQGVGSPQSALSLPDELDSNSQGGSYMSGNQDVYNFALFSGLLSAEQSAALPYTQLQPAAPGTSSFDDSSYNDLTHMQVMGSLLALHPLSANDSNPGYLAPPVMLPDGDPGAGSPNIHDSQIGEAGTLGMLPPFPNEISLTTTNNLGTKGSKPCPHCPKVLKTKYLLTRHLLCHAPKRFKCHQCGKKFPRKDSLERHDSSIVVAPTRTHTNFTSGTDGGCVVGGAPAWLASGGVGRWNTYRLTT